MNAVSKPRLRFFLSVGLYEILLLSRFGTLRAGNRQKGFARLVNTRGWGSSNKNCLNVLRGEGLKKRGGLSIGSGNIKTQRETAAKAGTQLDNETTENPGRERRAGIGAGIGAGIKAGTKASIRVGIGANTRAGTGAGTKRGNKTREDSKRGDKRDPIGIQSFVSHSFFLATHLFFFFTTSSSESVTTWSGLFTMASLTVNSKSVTSMKYGDSSSKYPVAGMWKPRAWRVSSAITSVLQPPKSKVSVFQSWLELKRYLSGSTLARGF